MNENELLLKRDAIELVHMAFKLWCLFGFLRKAFPLY
jgi:hypothetical protein